MNEALNEIDDNKELMTIIRKEMTHSHESSSFLATTRIKYVLVKWVEAIYSRQQTFVDSR